MLTKIKKILIPQITNVSELTAKIKEVKENVVLSNIDKKKIDNLVFLLEEIQKNSTIMEALNEKI